MSTATLVFSLLGLALSSTSTPDDVVRAPAPVGSRAVDDDAHVSAAPTSRLAASDSDDKWGKKSSSSSKSAKKKTTKKKPKKKSPPAKKGPVSIPIDVGVGPIALLPSTPLLLEDQPVHAGMMLSLGAIIDKATIEANRDRIPKQYRDLASRVSEVSVSPWWLALIPKVLIVSPAFVNTGMYGAIWRPYSLGISPEVGPVRLSFDAAIDLAYIFMHSATPGEEFTHFLRPGLNLEASARLPITEWLLISGGWSSTLFPPQKLGGWPWEFLPLERSIWHLGGPYFKIHIRFPYEVNL